MPVVLLEPSNIYRHVEMYQCSRQGPTGSKIYISRAAELLWTSAYCFEDQRGKGGG